MHDRDCGHCGYSVEYGMGVTLNGVVYCTHSHLVMDENFRRREARADALDDEYVYGDASRD